MKGFITKDNFMTALAVFILIVVWKILAFFIGADLILPPPEESFKALVEVVREEGFVLALAHTFFRGLLGFLLSFVMGLLVGIAAGLNHQVYTLLRPFLVFIRSTPVISVILLAIIWFTTDYVPVFTGFLMMFPVICINVIEGIKSVNQELVEMAEIYQAGRIRILMEVYLPAIAPFLIGGLSTALGIGWKAIVASEVLSQPQYALGTQMHIAQTYLMVPELVAWTIVAVSLGYLSEIFLRRVEKKLIVWK